MHCEPRTSENAAQAVLYRVAGLVLTVTDKVAPRRKLARVRMRQQHDDGVKQVCVAYHEMVRGVLVGEREGMTDQPEIY